MSQQSNQNESKVTVTSRTWASLVSSKSSAPPQPTTPPVSQPPSFDTHPSPPNEHNSPPSTVTSPTDSHHKNSTSFSFNRGNGVTISHRSTKSPGESCNQETDPAEQPTVLPVVVDEEKPIEQAPTPQLSWAQRAKVAAAQTQPTLPLHTPSPPAATKAPQRTEAALSPSHRRSNKNTGSDRAIAAVGDNGIRPSQKKASGNDKRCGRLAPKTEINHSKSSGNRQPRGSFSRENDLFLPRDRHPPRHHVQEQKNAGHSNAILPRLANTTAEPFPAVRRENIDRDDSEKGIRQESYGESHVEPAATKQYRNDGIKKYKDDACEHTEQPGDFGSDDSIQVDEKSLPTRVSVSPMDDAQRAIELLCSGTASLSLLLQSDSQTTNTAAGDEGDHDTGHENFSLSTPIVHAPFRPRGIQNPGNLCFVNSVLQALLGTHAFRALMHQLAAGRPLLEKHAEEAPVLSALSRISLEMRGQEESQMRLNHMAAMAAEKLKANNIAALGGKPLSSALIMELIHKFSVGSNGQQQQQQQGTKTVSKRASALDVEQEDAHEFLHFLLDAVHDELVAVGAEEAQSDTNKGNDLSSTNESTIDTDDDGWLVQSGKKAVRRQEVSATKNKDLETVISGLFQGKIATSVSCAAAPSSVTVHPFKVIGLPIGSDLIKNISDSFDSLTASETISGYKPSGSSQPMDATKTERFQELPDVLILHMMRFQFTGRSAKLSKYVAFEPKLQIRTGWLAPGSKERGAVYELVSTVTHHGKSIGNGHYTADVLQCNNSSSSSITSSMNHSGTIGGNQVNNPALQKWLRFDDGNVYGVKQEAVLADKPYLLVYQRVPRK